MTVSIRPLHPMLGGEVSGVDLTRPLNQEEVAAIDARLAETLSPMFGYCERHKP